MSAQPIRRWDQEIALLAWLTACISILSLLFYFKRGEILLYGDAVAHINIARRVFDSRTPGLLQLGTVWLPLPHLLMIPFLLSNWMWRTGVGGSIPSMVAYVFGTVGIFSLVRDGLGSAAQSFVMTRVAAWLAAIIYATNPNLIYLQATAMTEPLYLALFIWALVYFNEFVQRPEKSVGNGGQSTAPSPIVKCGLCLAGACLTRYDAWLLTIVIGVAALLVALRAKQRGLASVRGLRKFILLAAAAPALWLAYNAIVYRNPLEFATGPYSAKAIEQRSPATSHPGAHDLQTAFSYFLKSAELNLAAASWQKLWLLLGLAGVIAGLALKQFRGHLWPLLLLWIPLPFYSLSVAYSGVPIYVPVWWPFSYYNVRYGLNLPAFAVFVTLAFTSFVIATSRAGWYSGRIVFVATNILIWWLVSFSEGAVNLVTLFAGRELSDFVRCCLRLNSPYVLGHQWSLPAG
jgi:hypothetical protein